MKITVRNMYDMSIEAITYENAEVKNSNDYKTFSIVANGNEIATYNRESGMTYDIVADGESPAAIIAENKDDTAYYNEELTETNMYETLRYRMGFGEAETKCIIAALTLSGARWKKQ